MSDEDGILVPTNPEELRPSAILVQYDLISGPNLHRSINRNIEDKLQRTADIITVSEWDSTIVYQTLPLNPVHRERLLNPVQQTIGPRSLQRSSIDPEAFFDEIRPETEPPPVETVAPTSPEPQRRPAKKLKTADSTTNMDLPCDPPMDVNAAGQQINAVPEPVSTEVQNPQHPKPFRPCRHPATYKPHNIT